MENLNAIVIASRAAAYHQRDWKTVRHCRIVSVTLKNGGKRISLPNSRTRIGDMMAPGAYGQRPDRLE